MIAVTGATGHLGRLVIEALLGTGVPPKEIVALVRTPEKARHTAEQGVQVRRADYNEPDTLAPALQGVDRLLLISGSEVGQRIRQHGSVVEAARQVGVRLLAYTGCLKADTSSIRLAAEHKATEEVIRKSGIPFVFLRNGWYIENYTDQIPQYLDQGAILGSAGEGRVSAAIRAEYAAAAASVLTRRGHENAVYELGGDKAFTLNELAEELSRHSGRSVVYRDLPFEERVQDLLKAGLPDPFARILADSDLGIARGDLFTDSGDLSRLIGRPTTPLRDAVAAALRKHESRER